MIHKKIWFWVVMLVLIAVIGFGVYDVVKHHPFSVNHQPIIQTITPASPTTSTSPKVEVITAEPKQPESKGVFSICLDKCGDGICQDTASDCKEGDFNCVCLETKAECSQDCK